MASTGRKIAFSLLAAGVLALAVGGGFAVATNQNDNRYVYNTGKFSNISGLTLEEEMWELTSCEDVLDNQHAISSYNFLTFPNKSSHGGTEGLYNAGLDPLYCLAVSKSLGSTPEEALDRIRSEEFGYPAPQPGNKYVVSDNRYFGFGLDEVVETPHGVYLANQWDQWLEAEPELARFGGDR